MDAPSADDLFYAHVATYTLFSKMRIRLWEWSEANRRKVMLASFNAEADGIDAMRSAVIKKAIEILGQ